MLPRTLWAGVRRDRYAFTAALAVWLTVVFILAVTGRGSALWVLYGFVLALAVVSFVYLALIALAHAVTLAVQRKWRLLLPFAIATAAGLALVSPLAALAAGPERAQQLWWIGGGNYLNGVLWEQWLTGSKLFLCARSSFWAGARCCWSGVQFPAPRTCWQWRCPGCYSHCGVDRLLNVGQQRLPPEVPDLHRTGFRAAAGIVRCGDRPGSHPGSGSVAVGARDERRNRFPLTQRSANGKPGAADYSAVADVVAANSRPQDCVTFGFAQHEPLRAIAAARPDAFAGLDDVAAGVSGAYAAQLWTQSLPLDGDLVRSRLTACRVLWAVVDRSTPSPVVNDVLNSKVSLSTTSGNSTTPPSFDSEDGDAEASPDADESMSIREGRHPGRVTCDDPADRQGEHGRHAK